MDIIRLLFYWLNMTFIFSFAWKSPNHLTSFFYQTFYLFIFLWFFRRYIVWASVNFNWNYFLLSLLSYFSLYFYRLLCVIVISKIFFSFIVFYAMYFLNVDLGSRISHRIVYHRSAIFRHFLLKVYLLFPCSAVRLRQRNRYLDIGHRKITCATVDTAFKPVVVDFTDQSDSITFLQNEW